MMNTNPTPHSNDDLIKSGESGPVFISQPPKADTIPHSGDWLEELLEMTHGGCQIVADGVYKSCNESVKKAILSKHKLEVLEARKEQIMQDFMSTLDYVGATDEAKLIDWRENALSELENERSKIEELDNG